MTKSPNGNIETLLPPGNNSLFKPSTGAIPKLGEHNTILLKELGFTNKEIQDLALAEVI
jgi:itaconate CoA-transferase